MRMHAIGASPKFVVVFACLAVAFGLAGVGLMAFAVRKPKDQPIDARRISDQAQAGTLLFWGFALLWNLIAAPALVFLPDEIRKGHTIAWLTLLFPLVGIVLLANAIRLTARALRFRESTLALDATPVPLGGTLRGNVEVPHPLTSASGVMIRLVALSRRSSGRNTYDSIAAHEERELDPALIRRTADGAIIPIEIAVPADAPASDSTSANEKIFWRLTVDAEVPGVDYSATFDVPVERTAFTDFRPHEGPRSIAAPMHPKSFIDRQTPEGRELYFPRFHAKSRAMLSLAFAIAWIGAIAFMVAVGVPRVVPIVFAFIAIAIVLSTLELFLESRTILLGAHDVTLRRRMLSKSEQVIPYADIERASAVISAQANGARPYYRVDVETKDGKRIQAAKHIHSKREAEWVASRIKPRS